MTQYIDTIPSVRLSQFLTFSIFHPLLTLAASWILVRMASGTGTKNQRIFMFLLKARITS